MTKRSSAPAPQRSGSLYNDVLTKLSAEEKWEGRRLAFRRRVFAILCILTFLVLFVLMIKTLGQGGFNYPKLVMLLSFCITTPWAYNWILACCDWGVFITVFEGSYQSSLCRHAS